MGETFAARSDRSTECSVADIELRARQFLEGEAPTLWRRSYMPLWELHGFADNAAGAERRRRRLVRMQARLRLHTAPRPRRFHYWASRPSTTLDDPKHHHSRVVGLKHDHLARQHDYCSASAASSGGETARSNSMMSSIVAVR
jgi:hypothetical protein